MMSEVEDKYKKDIKKRMQVAMKSSSKHFK
jgi:hypothetical protein